MSTLDKIGLAVTLFEAVVLIVCVVLFWLPAMYAQIVPVSKEDTPNG